MNKIIYPLASSSWDESETTAAINVIKSGYCTMGELTKKAEQEFAQFTGSKYCVMSNSGSSANLISITALMYRKYGPKLNPGDVVLVPTVSWSTTYYPLYQNGLVMKFIDIDKDTLNISIDEVKKHITPEVKAIFAVNLLGNSCDFNQLQELCEKHNIILIEDNCESLGSIYKGKQAGSFGVMGNYSGYHSHHISAVEAGFTVTDDLEIYQLLLSIRSHGWTRPLPDKNFICNKTGVPFEDLFRFCLPGYNVRPNDIFAAITSEQLKKLPTFIQDRQRNAEYFKYALDRFNGHNLKITGQSETKDSKSSWFGFSMVLEGNLKGQRARIAQGLIDAGIEVRPIVAGDFSSNPVIEHMTHIKTTNTVAADIDKNGFFIGNNPGNLASQIDYFFEILQKLT